MVAPDVDLWVLGCLVRARDTSELWDLASTGKLVKTLGVAGLGNLERQVDKDFDELERRVVTLDFGVQLARGGAVGGKGRDEGCDGDGGGVGEELCDLWNTLAFIPFQASVAAARWCWEAQTYLRNAPDVLIPVLLTEPEILVQPKAHIVAIETVGSEAQV